MTEPKVKWMEGGEEIRASVDPMEKPLVDFMEEAITSGLRVSPDALERIEIGPNKKPGLRIYVDDWKFDVHISQVGLIS